MSTSYEGRIYVYMVYSVKCKESAPYKIIPIFSCGSVRLQSSCLSVNFQGWERSNIYFFCTAKEVDVGSSFPLHLCADKVCDEPFRAVPSCSRLVFVPFHTSGKTNNAFVLTKMLAFIFALDSLA